MSSGHYSVSVDRLGKFGYRYLRENNMSRNTELFEEKQVVLQFYFISVFLLLVIIYYIQLKVAVNY